MPISEYTYLIGTLFFLPIWLILFFSRKDLDKKMLEISIFVGILAILWSPFFWKDYWQPMYMYKVNIMGITIGGIEDFLYGFFTGGIISVLYEEILGKRFSKRKNRKHQWFLIYILTFFLFITVFYLAYYIGINSIYAAFLSFICIGVLMFFYRKDLLIDSLVSGCAFGILTLSLALLFTFIFPGVIQNWWLLKNLSGHLVFGIPIEELIWAFGMGAIAGPFYEYIMGLRLAKYTVKRKR